MYLTIIFSHSWWIIRLILHAVGWLGSPSLYTPHHWLVLASSCVELWHRCAGRSWVVLHAVAHRCPARPAPVLGLPNEAYTGTSRSNPQPTPDCCHLHPGFGQSPGWKQIRKSFLRGTKIHQYVNKFKATNIYFNHQIVKNHDCCLLNYRLSINSLQEVITHYTSKLSGHHAQTK